MSDGTHSPAAFMDEFGGSLVNLILGGMLLWIGQTTFEHNGELAGFHQQLNAINKRHDMLSERYNRMIDSVNNRTRSRFTREDGDKLSQRIKSVELSELSMRERIQDRLGDLRVQVSALEIKLQESPQTASFADPDTASLRVEINTLRNDLDRLTRSVWRPALSGGAVSGPRASLPTLPVGARSGNRATNR